MKVKVPFFEMEMIDEAFGMWSCIMATIMGITISVCVAFKYVDHTPVFKKVIESSKPFEDK